MKTLKLSGGMKVVDLSKPDPRLADSHAGQHSDKNGPFEVWYNAGNLTTHPGPAPAGAVVSDIEEPGWYWWPCHPGCLPDGEAEGPYVTSHEAYVAAFARVGEDPPDEDPNRDGVRLVEGDDLWEGATAGWYVFKDGNSTGPFDTEAEAYDRTGTDTGSGGPA